MERRWFIACALLLGVLSEGNSRALGELSHASAVRAASTGRQSSNDGPAAATSEEVPPPTPTSAAPPDAPPTITDLIIILDSTASMQYPCVWYGERRLAIAVWGAYDVVDACPDGLPLSVVRLRDDAEPLRPLEPITAEQKAVLRRGLMTGGPKGNAVLKSGFEMATRLLEDKPQAVPQIVLFTDGHDCEPGNAHGEVAHLKRIYGDRFHFDVLATTAEPKVLKVLSALADAGEGNFASVTSNRELATALAAVRNRCDDVRARIAAEHQTCVTELAACCQAKAACESELAVVRDDLAECLAEKTRLEERIQCLEEEKAQLETEVADLTAKLQATEKQLAATQADLEAARRTIKKLKTDLEQCLAERNQLRSDLAVARARIQALEENLGDLRTRHAWLWWFWWLTVVAFVLLLGLFLGWGWLRRHYWWHELQGCRSKHAELEQDLECCRRRCCQLEQQLQDCQQGSATLTHQLQTAENQHQLDLATIAQVRNDLAAERVRADGLDRRFSESQIHLSHCHHANATADERIQGFLRELALKKDCCCCKDGPSVVYGPVTTTPNGPVTTSPVTTPSQGPTSPIVDSSAPTVTTPSTTPTVTPSTTPTVTPSSAPTVTPSTTPTVTPTVTPSTPSVTPTTPTVPSTPAPPTPPTVAPPAVVSDGGSSTPSVLVVAVVLI
ncbi:MAG: VWA domain-containing protein [Planctomycetaceae bacterium]|nr:VWA domain-containing protein [Planctomycetaceae bacterium]